MINFTDFSYVKTTTFSDNLQFNISQLLDINHKSIVKKHVLAVAQTSQRLAHQFDLDENICYQSALLHDISAIIRPDDMKKLAIQNHYVLDEAENKYPFLLHQMVSKWIAQDIFQVQDKRILSAIACHTTLKANPSPYDMVLFLADKITWDQEGIPPYLERIEKSLDISLEKACYEYIRYLFENHQLLYPHQRIKEARDFLYQKYLPITFRHWHENEGEMFYQHSHSDKLYQYMNEDFPKTLEECKKTVRELSQSKDEVKVILLDGEIIGCIAGFYENDSKVKLAYWLDVHYWQQGIMSTVLNKFIQWLFAKKNIQYVYAEPFEENMASINLLEKLQFQKVIHENQIVTYIRKAY